MIYDLGGGHRNTANALRDEIKQRNLPWQVHIVEFFRDIVGTDAPHKVYNDFVLKKKWARIINEPLLVPSFKLQVRLCHARWRRLLETYWQNHQPDLVISVLPYVNRVINESLKTNLPNVPFITHPIDLADSPPHFWIEPQEQLLICPSELMSQQAQKLGYSEELIIRTSGAVVNPRFYEPITLDRRSEKQRLGLDPDLPTGLVMFGGYGSNVMAKIANSIEQSSLNIQLIFICGHDERVAEILTAMPSRLPRLVKKFTKEIPYYMHLSDFFIGKPGPTNMSEALLKNLPVITECNALTLFQERYNTKWIAENKFGIVVDDFSNINQAVAELIEPENFARYQSNIKAYNNQAVFEVVDSLETILETSPVEDCLNSSIRRLINIEKAIANNQEEVIIS